MVILSIKTAPNDVYMEFCSTYNLQSKDKECDASMNAMISVDHPLTYFKPGLQMLTTKLNAVSSVIKYDITSEWGEVREVRLWSVGWDSDIHAWMCRMLQSPQGQTCTCHLHEAEWPLQHKFNSHQLLTVCSEPASSRGGGLTLSIFTIRPRTSA